MFPRDRLVQRLTRMLASPRLAARSTEDSSVAEAREAPPVGRSLAEILPGGSTWTGSSGACWVVEPEPKRERSKLLERLTPALAGPPASNPPLWPAQWAAPRLVVIDIETCGFAALPIFQIGVLVADSDGLRLAQAVARDYSEEPALLEWASREIDAAGCVVSFNGKSFDMRYLRERIAYHRLPPLEERPHVDLLHIARRLWGERLPDCRLQTLETELCGRKRRGDIPGAAIPDVYHAFVGNGDARDIAMVLNHNRMDLLTLAELFAGAWHHISTADGANANH